jgi:hypothetical protein
MKSQRETAIRTNLISKLKNDFITETEIGRSRYPNMNDEEMLDHLRILFYLFLEKYCFVKRVTIRERVIVLSRKIEEKGYEAENNIIFFCRKSSKCNASSDTRNIKRKGNHVNIKRA